MVSKFYFEHMLGADGYIPVIGDLVALKLSYNT